MSDSDVVGPVPSRIVGGGFVPLERFFASPENRDAIASNGPLEGREGLRFAMLCSGVADHALDKYMDQPFDVVYWHASYYEYLDQQTGELSDRVRLVFVDAAGETYSTSSVGVIGSLDRIRRYMGDGPYDPPLTVMCVAQRTRSDRTILQLRMVDGG